MAPQRNLVQRGAGALRARDRAERDLARFAAMCERERCPFAVVGTRDGATGASCVADPQFGNRPVDMDARRAARQAAEDDARRRPRAARAAAAGPGAASTVRDAAYRVLQFPAVADKTFLVTIGDRTVGGLCARDPMVGPWQVPVADCAVTLIDFDGLRRRGDGDRRAAAAGADRRAGVGAHGGRRGADQPRRGRRSRRCRRQAVGQLDGARRATPARTPRCSTPCARSRWSSAPRSGVAIPVGKDSMSMRRAGATVRASAR